MCKMADSLPLRQAAAIRLALALLIGCLGMHFLVEDLVLFSNASASVQAGSSASLLALDEAEHLDDLVLVTGQPAQITHSVLPCAFAWANPPAEQAPLTILRPPKI